MALLIYIPTKIIVVVLLTVFIFSIHVVSEQKEIVGKDQVHVSFFGDQTDLDIIHFDDEQSFIDRFGDDPHIANMFNNTKKAKMDKQIPGDMGLPFAISNPTEEIEKEVRDGYSKYGYNKYISDFIPLDRRLPDIRNQWCFTPHRIAPLLLPTSVIICFYNEALSVLLRTIYSILNRSPPHLLAEIILIDDFSDYDETKEELSEAVKSLNKVKLIRLPKREGLIRARLLGALLAQAPVLTFLDSHIEVSVGWLEPLLDRVTKNWKSIAIPVFNPIDPATFACNFTGKPIAVGGFKWDLKFTFRDIKEWNLRNVTSPADPIPSPTMPGGFFSIHRDFFDYLGKFDSEYEIWGAENLELSFKAWMCGGSVDICPCSHIAHLERIHSVYSRETTARNLARLAAVWLDEYAGFYFKISKKSLPKPGDIAGRMELKKNLNCSSFDWYLKNIAVNMFSPKQSYAFGEVRNVGQRFCLDSHESSTNLPSLIWPECHGQGGNQFWYYTALGEIRNEEKCLDYFGDDNIVLFPCHGLGGNQNWEYHAETGSIVHSSSSLCLTLNVEGEGKVVMEPCQGMINQQWKFEFDKIHDTLGNFRFR